MSNIFDDINLRKKILSYCPKKIIKCHNCKQICVIDNNIIKRYVEIPIKDYSIIYYKCLPCEWKYETMDKI